MNKILCLPDPLFVTWSENNFLSSLMQIPKYGMEWLMQTHINLYGSYYWTDNWTSAYDETRLTFYPYSISSLDCNLYKLCPYLKEYQIPFRGLYFDERNIWIRHKSEMMDMIKRLIEKGYYIQIDLQQIWRNDYPNIIHPTYIYGIKDDVAYIVDNFDKGKYEKRIISLEKLEESFTVHMNCFTAFELINLNYNALPFDVNFIKQQIEDYFTPCFKDYLSYFVCPHEEYNRKHEKGEHYIGRRAFNVLFHALDRNNCYIDYRSFCFLQDIITLWLKRHQYLTKNKYIEDNSIVVTKWNQLEQQAKVIQNRILLCVKTDKDKRQKRIDKVKSLLTDFISSYEELLKYYLEIL